MTTTPIRVLLAAALLTATGAVCTAQTDDSRQQTPNFKVEVWGSSQGDFGKLVNAYADLRAKLQVGAPVLSVTDDPKEITKAETILAARIRAARPGAKRGDIFTRAIGAAFRKVLWSEMNERTWAAIMDENPEEFEHAILGTYPKTRPLSTVPPNILAKLPALPPRIEYRFLGRDLILHDTDANVIVDRLPHAISCRHCDK